MCNCKNNGFNFVFHELSRKEKPCLNLRNKEDAALLAEALTFAKDHCVKVDGCCSSRVYARLADIQSIVKTDDRDLGTVAKALKYGLVCEKEEAEQFCCDDRAADTFTDSDATRNGITTW